MNVFELLKEDHQKVSELFEKIEQSGKDLKQKHLYFKEVKIALTIHTELEEMLLYPEIINPDKTHELTQSAYEQHNMVENLLEKLDSLAMTDSEWDKTFRELVVNVNSHVREEEKQIFPKTEKVLDPQLLRNMAISMRIEKEKLFKKYHAFS